MGWRRWVVITGAVISTGFIGSAVHQGLRYFIPGYESYYTGCAIDGDCAAGEFCSLVDCASPGRCRAIPAACGAEVGPVCGCDGTIYDNRCEADILSKSADKDNDCITALEGYTLRTDPAFSPGLVPLPQGEQNTANAVTGDTKWVTFYDLGPIEGLHGVDSSQDVVDNNPLRSFGQLGFTNEVISGYQFGLRPPVKWLVDIQNPDTYKIFTRRSNTRVIGSTITVDEEDIDTTGAGPLVVNGCDPCYDWYYVGEASLSAGVHWFDFELPSQHYDVVLITSDTDFSPTDTGVLALSAAYDSDPQTYGERYVRGQNLIDAQVDTDSNVPHLVVCKDVSDSWHEDMRDFEIAAADPVIAVGRNHYGSASFKLLAGAKGAEVDISLDALYDTDSNEIPASDISVRIVRPVRTQAQYHILDVSAGNKNMFRDVASVLVNDARTSRWNGGWQGGFANVHAQTSIPPYGTASVWVTVDPSSTLNAVDYTGAIHIRDLKNTWLHTTLPITVSVSDITLPENANTNGIFYHYSGNPLASSSLDIGEDRYALDMDYTRRLDFNSLTLQAGYVVQDTSGSIVNEYDVNTTFAKGLTKPPTHMFPTLNQVSTATMETILLDADSTGFEAPYVRVFEYDEPRDETAFNTLDARLQNTKTVEAEIQGTYPQYVVESSVTFNTVEACTWVPTDTDNPYVGQTFMERVEDPLFSWIPPLQTYADEARSNGFNPRTYWTVQSSSPLAQRLTAGFETQARRFEGVQPFAFLFVDAGIPYFDFDLTESIYENALSYPDEFGNPIPTRRGEAMGEGLIDARYYQLIETWIAETGDCAQYGDTDPADTDPASVVLRASDLFGIISTSYGNNTFPVRRETNRGPTERRDDITTAVLDLQTAWGTTDPLDTDIDTSICIP